MKIICLDYDGSYNTFPELFDTIVQKSKQLGYRVILATMRYPEEIDNGLKEIQNKGVELFFTSREGKQNYLEKKGIRPNIWIDDTPMWILYGA